MRQAGILVTVCLAVWAGAGATSSAADLGATTMAPPAPVSTEGWIITLKGNVSYSTNWQGSKSYGAEGYPSISFRRASEPATWSAPDDGFGLPIYEARGFSVGPVARYDSGRYRSDDQKLFGLRDVRWTIEPGAFVEFWPIPDTLRAHFELRHGVDSRDGFVADAAVDYLWHIGSATLALGPRLSLGDQDFLRRDYGVSFTDAVQNGIVSPFKPNGGLHSAGVATSLTYDMTQAWSTTVYGNYDRLVSDASKSPLIRKLGSADQFKAGLTVSYSFGFSGF